MATSVEQSSSPERESATTRLISSGMARLKERIPASTWASGTCALAATSAPPRVELVSP